MGLAIEGGTPIRTKPFPPWPYFWEDEKEAVRQVLDSGKVNYWTGTLGMTFQEKFAEFVGTRYAIAVNSGTAALHIALAAAEVGPGDEVIVPARTFVATAVAVVHQNAVPVFADVDLDTHNISVESIKSLITERTKAIIPVHLAGHPADMDPIMELAEEHGLVVIEDAAQSPGAEYKGRKVGSLGDLAAFSFCQDKHFTTGGEGGMVTTDDATMAEIARSVKDHGYWEEEHRSLLEMEALYTYIHHRPGWNYRLTEMQSAIGLKALERLDWMVDVRRRNAHYLSESLKNVEQMNVAYEAPWAEHSFYKYYGTLNLDKLRVDRDAFVKAVRAEGVPIGIGTASEDYLEEIFQKKVGYGKTSCPFTCPWYKGDLDYTQVVCPNARRLSKEVFVLLVHPTIELEDLDDVIAAINKVAQAYSLEA
jgi:dTDP-4-amino-4,6-dideoxygalactose transaminase